MQTAAGEGGVMAPRETRIPFIQSLIGKVLDGTKTVTRRPIRGVSHCDRMRREPFLQSAWGDTPVWEAADNSSEPDNWPVRCPYGYVGDILLPTETWAVHYLLDAIKPSLLHNTEHVWYRQDVETQTPKQDAQNANGIRGKWRPPMFMPKWASRGRLEILSVRVERVQEITDQDCVAEGTGLARIQDAPDDTRGPLIDGFRLAWDAAYPKLPWALNPWVWRIEFRRVT